MVWTTDIARAFAAVLILSTAAGAATTSLYDGVGSYSMIGNIGDGDGLTTGQQFNASNAGLPSRLPATAMIDRAALHIAVDPNKPSLGDPGLFTFQVWLWTWNTDLATTMAGTPIADTGEVSLAGGFDGWAELEFPPQSASGTYFLGVTRKALAINGQWRIQRTSSNSGAADSVAYRGGSGPQGDREWALRLHSFDPACGTTAAARVTGLVGGTVLAGSPAHTLTLSGSNLNTINGVSLVRRHVNGLGTTMVGSGLTMVGADLQVTFDLVGAEGGPYDLLLAHPCDRLANASDPVLSDSTLLPLKGAVVVYLPALTNGSFEDAWNGDTVGGFCSVPRGLDLVEPRHWSYNVGMTAVSGNAWRRDGSVWVPGCTGTSPAGGDGLHYASFQYSSIWPIRHSAFQTIAASGIAGQVVEKGLNVKVSYRLSQAANQGVLRLRDGTNTGPVIAETVLGYVSEDPLRSGSKVTLEPGYVFVSNPPLLTVEVQFDSDGGSSPHAMHFDHVRINEGCHLPFADTDGDHDVDSADFAVWQACYSPNAPIPSDPAYCACFERIANGYIDEADLAEFIKCETGPAVPWVECNP